MDKEDIIRMAREAGFADGVVDIVGFEGFFHFANLVAAHERDRIADKLMEMHNAQKNRNNYFAFAARVIREEI